jgi:hypothetical protein
VTTSQTILSTAPTRREDNALLRGLACFGQDVVLPGAWHIAFVRSPHAHARLLGLDAQAAQDMAGVVAVLGIGLPFSHFGATEAGMVAVVITAAAWLGFHPVILGMVIGPWIAELNPDPNLLAMSLLMPWAFGLTACPLGNTILAMHARYQVPTRELLARNRSYSGRMLLLSLVVLQVYERLTVI